MSTLYYFLQAVPECMGLIALSLAVGRVPLRWSRILAGGFIISLLTFAIRSLPLTFGIHLPVAILVIYLLIISTTKVTPSRTIISVFCSFFVLALLEFIFSSTFFACTHMDFEQAFANEKLWSLVGLAQAITLNLVALAVAHFMKPIEGAWKK